jgi:hypothetical protein
MRSGEHVLIEHYISFSRPRKDRYFWFWHEADATWARSGVRFQGESGHDTDWRSLPSLTHSRHDDAA